ncbi:iron dicitrate transport regulator FecR [Diaphorobacter nitroreducens]|nr:iron dicitrate transport regulator FecR [Diaphorobacter nitroreducens]
MPDDVIDAAIAWSVKLNHNPASEAAQRAFEHWLGADPLHARAWARIGVLRGDLARLPQRLALETLQATDAQRQSNTRGRRRALKLLSVSGLALSLGWTLRENSPWQRLVADAFTAVGEQKTLHLPDGTVLVLNTDSAVNTDLGGESRLIVLRRGEIMVTTGSDTASGSKAKRPFWVITPFGRLQALGTRFVVRLGADHARISVQEGAVELHPVRPAEPGAVPAVVRAGESRWLTDTASLPAAAQDFDAEAWADGVVSGRDMRLGDLVAELGRYRSGHIVCDERVADLRVSGVFHVRDTDQALRFLVQTQPVNITYRTRWWVSVVPKVVP